MEFSYLSSYLVCGFLIYLIYVGYGFWFKVAKKKREIFPDDHDYYKMHGIHYLMPGPDLDDPRHIQYKQVFFHMYRKDMIKFLIAIIGIIFFSQIG